MSPFQQFPPPGAPGSIDWVSVMNYTIGNLDRALSELKLLALDARLDEADAQTIKHHAEDCIGLGNRVLQILKERSEVK